MTCPLLWFFFCVIFPLVTSSAIELSVCSGVVGCGCPISSRMILMYTASRVMMYNTASSASVADDITCLIMCAMLSRDPLLEGIPPPFDRKKCPPALLLAFGSLR